MSVHFLSFARATRSNIAPSYLSRLRYFFSRSAQQEELFTANQTSASIGSQSDNLATQRVFTLPKGFKPVVIQRPDYIEKALAPLVDILDQEPSAALYLSLDAEWNVRRRIGVSVLQLCAHIDPPAVYIISVHQLSSLPPSLLRLLTSERVYKVGSRIKGDLTRLRKQFPSQLTDHVRFSTIDLKEYALTRGIIQPKQTGTLAALCETVLGVQLPKDTRLRAHNSWEFPIISTSLIHYAACDVLVTRRIFETMSTMTPEPGEDFDDAVQGALDDDIDDIGGVQVAATESVLGRPFI
ncbi:hypothetical protein BT96DRAFT_948054 [Gymnopus androsaceus JB14]|uniref:3'-5' exonuclease domain-containing protein n=1 Tax=Gymnopus androsaceus JB14 TaxID=1447944 RepID=A0A6A4GR63_9AGAR|nr:hypothetical protein BT96DRAFT_948054 [Gymnopus androsaceus JB14]